MIADAAWHDSNYISKVTIPLLTEKLRWYGWEAREWDYKLGYIEMDYVTIPRDSSKLIFMRNSASEELWDQNSWDVAIKLSPVTRGLSLSELITVTDLTKALAESQEEYFKYNDLIDSDFDKISEKRDHVLYEVLQ